MSDSPAPTRGRRLGVETKRDAQRVALELFTSRGYEATSMREIAEALGINKASLYYYFPGKEAILLSLFDDRGAEVSELLAWLKEQPRTADLVEKTVLRWVDSFSAEKLAGIRFLAANPLAVRRIGAQAGASIGSGLQELADTLGGLLPHPSPRRRLLLRMSLTSINAAVHAAIESGIPDDVIIRTAHEAALLLLEQATAPETGDAGPLSRTRTGATG